MYQNKYSGKYCQKRIRMGLMQLLYAVNILVFLASTLCIFGSAQMEPNVPGLINPALITIVEVPW